MFKIDFFETDDGRQPVRDFLLTLDEKMRTKVLCNMKHLQANGYELREPLSAPLGDKIFELRTQSAITSRGCCTSSMSAKRLS